MLLKIYRHAVISYIALGYGSPVAPCGHKELIGALSTLFIARIYGYGKEMVSLTYTALLRAKTMIYTFI